MVQYAVIGLGNFGHHVAVGLASRGHQVLAIDKEQKRVEAIRELVTQAVSLDVMDRDGLADFVTPAVDAAIVGMDENLEASILATLFLKEIGVKRVVVKAVSSHHARAVELVGATDVVQPERNVASSLCERLTAPNVLNATSLCPGYTLADIGSPEQFWGRTLAELKIRTSYNVLVIAVRELLRNRVHSLPGPDFEVAPDTVLTVLGRNEDDARLPFVRN